MIDDEESRRKITVALGRTRSRYRQFRSRLSQEIAQSNVLPMDLQRRLVSELDKRLDLDLDAIVESPKLRLKLSPAELDMQLLELYDTITRGPGGDVLRVIGGGNDVAMQDFYLKSQARKEGRKGGRELGLPAVVHEDDGSLTEGADVASALPHFLDDISEEEEEEEEEERSPTKWVKRALRRNLPQKYDGTGTLNFMTTQRRGPPSHRAGRARPKCPCQIFPPDGEASSTEEGLWASLWFPARTVIFATFPNAP